MRKPETHKVLITCPKLLIDKVSKAPCRRYLTALLRQFTFKV